MLIADLLLRGAAAVLLLLLAVVLLRDYRRVPAGWSSALLAIGGAAYAISAAPGLNGSDGWWLASLRLIAFGNAALLWLFAAAAFDDGFVPSWRHGLAWVAALAVGSACAFAHLPLACQGFPLLSLLYIGLAIRCALRGRTGDLVEARRRFRLVVIGAASLFGAILVLREFLAQGGPAAPADSLAQAAGLAALAFGIAVARLSFAPAHEAILPEPPPKSASDPASVDPQEALLVAELERLMRVDRVYRQEGLGIATLAERMGIPEYRLRRLINQRLGHRNFTAFVNGYRLAEAKQALADPSQATVPILTIALDAGFQSIGPFNRAFKSETGLTPSEFRRRKPSD